MQQTIYIQNQATTAMSWLPRLRAALLNRLYINHSGKGVHKVHVNRVGIPHWEQRPEKC